LCIDTEREVCYITELGPSYSDSRGNPNLGPRITILNLNGERVARFGDIRRGEEPHQFIAPHGIAVDSRGDLYIGEVSWTYVGCHLDPPREMHTLRKLVKTRAGS